MKLKSRTERRWFLLSLTNNNRMFCWNLDERVLNFLAEDLLDLRFENRLVVGWISRTFPILALLLPTGALAGKHLPRRFDLPLSIFRILVDQLLLSRCLKFRYGSSAWRTEESGFLDQLDCTDKVEKLNFVLVKECRQTWKIIIKMIVFSQM
jgi:hypothetical protein